MEKQLTQLRVRCSGTHEGHGAMLDELVSAVHGGACACHVVFTHANDRPELNNGQRRVNLERLYLAGCLPPMHLLRTFVTSLERP